MVRLLIALLVLCTASISSAGMQAPRKLVAAATGGASYTDNFNRADENPLSGGGIWTNVGGSYGDMKVLSNAATSATGNGLAVYSTSAHTFSANQYSQVKITTNDNSGAGPVVRYSGTYFYRADVSYGDAVITRVADGNGANWTVGTGQTIAGKVLKLSASGGSTTTLRLYIDGVQIGSDVTDNSAYVLTSGQPGMITSTSGTLDDWEGGEL